jgi:hypothetical protein
VAEMVTYIKLISVQGEYKFIWRQRTLEYTSIYEYIHDIFPELDIKLSAGGDVSELARNSILSIGFGSNSSLAYELVEEGVVNLYGSSEFGEEYVPLIKDFHTTFGPIDATKRTIDIFKNEASYLNSIIQQQSFLMNM